jgi:hypothetical protein
MIDEMLSLWLQSFLVNQAFAHGRTLSWQIKDATIPTELSDDPGRLVMGPDLRKATARCR